ncbi:MAG: 3-hydroxyacyl-CoA dehydrogenase [Candidatus Nezhaarchaeales archaeon]
MEVNRIAVIGAGTMGSDVSFLFALSGFDVVIMDISERVLRALKGKYMKNMEILQQTSAAKEDFESVWRRVSLTTSLKDVKDVDFVFEAVSENLDLKKMLFRSLDDLLPKRVVLATNTSSLTITEIAEGIRGASRIGGMHFSNPPILMPLVEVIKGRDTSEEALNVIVQVTKRLGKTPVVIRKDMRGFVLNRILYAAGAEALWALWRGEATPMDIDSSVKAMGYPMGFFEAIDVIGLDVLLAVFRNLHEAYGERFLIPIRLLEEMIEKGKLGKKVGEGFYDWSKGAPQIEAKPSEAYNVMRMVATATNEAFWIIKDGVADPETIDEIVKLGMLSPVGVCELADTVGLDNLASLLNEMCDKYRLELYKLCPLFEEYLKNGWTGRSAGRGFYVYQEGAI